MNSSRQTKNSSESHDLTQQRHRDNNPGGSSMPDGIPTSGTSVAPAVERRLEAGKSAETSSTSQSQNPIVGLLGSKRKRGGKVTLKTGVLTPDKRAKTEDATSGASAVSAKESSSNAYLEEMKKYSDQLCAEERHARPLVK
ncbi:hypothetical protein BV898_07772 [Hypsibius exemplaris]|uniref:Uncharacterized protein n=1 Tax=Hypsibius exemplaris TaxID=2072580 RepID=A0A1W0WSK7_HYPEX|nr:hypothetical protein BV898_07772 [Hypsibius exemplaris]